ncbi:Uncharacterised protein [Bordetella pertussis]|nr:Uncharacterised protein [Bordetella pertussis]
MSAGAPSTPRLASSHRRSHSREKSAWISARASGATLTGTGHAAERWAFTSTPCYRNCAN